MQTQNVTIPLDVDVANFYLSASEQEKMRMQWLMNLWLKRSIFSTPKRPLTEIMDEAGRIAKESGLTEKILQEILAERP
jgi:hypothetical protein